MTSKIIEGAKEAQPDIISRLNDIWSDDDHERGCQGRTYSCTCGFDERTFATAKDAADLIATLRQQLAEAREILACALDDCEQHDGVLKDEIDPHWSNDARRALAAGREG